MARRSDHTREELKQLILNTSHEIVTQDGFDALTARRIAKVIGYTPGTIYNLFDSMDDLYLHVNAETLSLLHNILLKAFDVDDNADPAEKMKKMASLYIHFTQQHRERWLMLFQHTTPHDFEIPEWFDKIIEEIFSPLENLLNDFFSPTEERKKKMAARILWTSVHGLCFLQETGKIGIVDTNTPTEKIAHYSIGVFLNGLNQLRSN